VTPEIGQSLPKQIGPFIIDSEIGRGGMGVVFKARDPNLNREVALKTVRTNDDQRLAERLREEARSWGPLRSPLIAVPYQFGNADGVAFVAMEYIEGNDLATVINQRNRRSLRFDLWIVMQVLEALEYTHSKGTIHRDIKPSNVMVLPDGAIKLIDFGLARAVESVRPMSVGVGTPSYMAPEQQSGLCVDQRADLFAVGALAYELLTNRRPFDASERRPPKPAPLGIDWSTRFPQLEAIVFKALEPSPDDRFQSAREMRTALEELCEDAAFAAALKDETILLSEPKTPKRPRRTTAQAAQAVVKPALAISLRGRNFRILRGALVVTLVALCLGQNGHSASIRPKWRVSSDVVLSGQQAAQARNDASPNSRSLQNSSSDERQKTQYATKVPKQNLILPVLRPRNAEPPLPPDNLEPAQRRSDAPTPLDVTRTEPNTAALAIKTGGVPTANDRDGREVIVGGENPLPLDGTVPLVAEATRLRSEPPASQPAAASTTPRRRTDLLVGVSSRSKNQCSSVCPPTAVDYYASQTGTRGIDFKAFCPTTCSFRVFLDDGPAVEIQLDGPKIRVPITVGTPHNFRVEMNGGSAATYQLTVIQ